MERRILGWVLSFAHLVVAGGAIGLVGTVLMYAFAMTAELVGGASSLYASKAMMLVPYAAGVAMLFAWDLGLSFWTSRSIARGNALAMDGRYSEASEVLRTLQDSEIVLRLAGVAGWVFGRARVVEAYACLLNGMGREAYDLALGLTRATPLGRVAAGVAALAAAERGDRASIERIPARLREDAMRFPSRASSVAILSALAHLELQALRLDDAARLVALLPAGSRSALSQGAFLAMARGDLDAAEPLLVAARLAPRAQGSRAQAALFQVQLTDLALAELALARGDARAAAARIAEIAKAGPRHRFVRVALVFFPAIAEGAAAARAALPGLAALGEQWSFDPTMSWRIALASARLQRAAGDRAAARAALRPAIDGAPPLVRQEALFEDGSIAREAGDVAGARASLEAAAALSPATRVGKLAGEALAAVTSVTSPA